MLLLGLAAVLLANTSQPEVYQRAILERDVLAEVNAARAHPERYASTLVEYRARIRDGVAYTPDSPDGIELEEGVGAVDEAIGFVKASSPRAPLEWDPDLASTAAAHAVDQEATGLVGHEGSDGASFERRMQALRTRGLVAEVISYGEQSTRGVVRQLIIDDGVRDRGHRKDVFDPSIRRAGVACRPHPEYGFSCVIDLSSN